jgi:hypothetical protein
MKSISDLIEANDVIIRVHNQTYQCHRAILSKCTPYFQSFVVYLYSLLINDSQRTRHITLLFIRT